MEATKALVLALNSVGAIFEVAGILVLSHRGPEIRAKLHAWWTAQTARFKANDAVLRGIFGKHVYAAPIFGLRYLFPIRMAGHSTSKTTSTGTLSLVPPTAPLAWRQAVWARLNQIDDRVTEVDRDLREFVGDEVKDSTRGLMLLGIGVIFIVAANVVSAL